MSVNNVKVQKGKDDNAGDLGRDFTEDEKDDAQEKIGDTAEMEIPADCAQRVHLWPAFVNQPGITVDAKGPLSNADGSGEALRIEFANPPICRRAIPIRDDHQQEENFPSSIPTPETFNDEMTMRTVASGPLASVQNNNGPSLRKMSDVALCHDAADGFLAVSYTHLTLPTILRV